MSYQRRYRELNLPLWRKLRFCGTTAGYQRHSTLGSSYSQICYVTNGCAHTCDMLTEMKSDMA